jgi:hypothetical protein
MLPSSDLRCEGRQSIGHHLHYAEGRGLEKGREHTHGSDPRGLLHRLKAHLENNQERRQKGRIGLAQTCHQRCSKTRKAESSLHCLLVANQFLNPANNETS